MNPILRDLDKLYFCSFEKGEIRAGDVVVIDTGLEKKVIHRVVSVNERGIITRGDNNYADDSWTLRSEQIAGKVMYALRGKRKWIVRGGWGGQIQSAPTIFKRKLLWRVHGILRPIYQGLVTSEKLGFISLPVKAIALQRPEGVELLLMLSGHIVGKKKTGEPWRIKPPMRLFLKESDLSEIVDRMNSLQSPRMK
ncbi:MAG: hypothetical protein HPY61_11160 [Methanotrichaceae archaeon]|nr:hypothetical protein [Methanotrichaceae archaeon]